MRSSIIGTVLAFATFLAAQPALAGDTHDAGAKFPMPAAAFKERVDARQAKAREHMERRAARLPAEEAKELRARFDAGIARINVEVGKATADGTVTKEEAHAVRKVAREVHRHRRGGHGEPRK